ncbi:MAG: DUF4158 domain-containing protein [Cyanobacteria bacterium P01_H01_bin.15]
MRALHWQCPMRSGVDVTGCCSALLLLLPLNLRRVTAASPPCTLRCSRSSAPACAREEDGRERGGRPAARGGVRVRRRGRAGDGGGQRQRYRPITLPQDFSDEEMFRDWQLSTEDCHELKKFQKRFRLHLAIQICAVRLYGRLLSRVHDLSPRIASHLRKQLDLPPALKIQTPERKKTYFEQLRNILEYLGFKRFDESTQQDLNAWLHCQAQQNCLPEELFEQAEIYLFGKRVLLPGPSVIERLVIRVCSEVNLQLFESVFQQLSSEHLQAIEQILSIPEAEQRSYFSRLKDYPPAATISTIQTYLHRYKTVVETGIDKGHFPMLTSAFLGYFFKQVKRYNAADLKRFNKHKRYALMVCFLLETRKILLDHLVTMHDQYMLSLSRRLTHRYEMKHREFRKRQKKAVDVVLETNTILLE